MKIDETISILSKISTSLKRLNSPEIEQRLLHIFKKIVMASEHIRYMDGTDEDGIFYGCLATNLNKNENLGILICESPKIIDSETGYVYTPTNAVEKAKAVISYGKVGHFSKNESAPLTKIADIDLDNYKFVLKHKQRTSTAKHK